MLGLRKYSGVRECIDSNLSIKVQAATTTTTTTMEKKSCACDNVVGSLVILWWVHFTIEFLIKSFNELENRVNVKVTYNGRFMHINVAM